DQSRQDIGGESQGVLTRREVRSLGQSFSRSPRLCAGGFVLRRTGPENRKNFLFAYILPPGHDQPPLGRTPPFHQAATPHTLDAPLRQEPERERVYSMLDLKNAGSERLGGIVVADGHRRLRNDRTGIGLRDDEVNRRARYLHSRLESLAVRIET